MGISKKGKYALWSGNMSYARIPSDKSLFFESKAEAIAEGHSVYGSSKAWWVTEDSMIGGTTVYKHKI